MNRLQHAQVIAQKTGHSTIHMSAELEKMAVATYQHSFNALDDSAKRAIALDLYWTVK